MSRLLKKPILFDNAVKITREGDNLKFTGGKGEIILDVPTGITVEISENSIKLTGSKDVPLSMIGLYISRIRNSLTGVKDGWSKTLELVGVGFRAETTGTKLTMNLGFSHPVIIDAPQGITFQVAESKITVSGVNKYMVGELAATIRRAKPPEPYKGKGIKYQGEIIRKKLGKAAKAVGGAAGAK